MTHNAINFPLNSYARPPILYPLPHNLSAPAPNFPVEFFPIPHNNFPMDDKLPERTVNVSPVQDFRGIVLNKEDPTSLYWMVTHQFWERIEAIPKDYLVMNPKELERRVNAGLVLEALRCSFWVEFNRCALDGYTRMIMSRVYGGICTEQYFFGKVIYNGLFLAFLLTPPSDYVTSLNAMLNRTLKRMHEIISLPIVSKTGEVDHRTAALILKAHEMIETRVKGAVIQRTESKQLNVSLKAGLNEDDLDAKLKMLRERERQLNAGRVTSDASLVTEATRVTSETKAD